MLTLMRTVSPSRIIQLNRAKNRHKYMKKINKITFANYFSQNTNKM